MSLLAALDVFAGSISDHELLEQVEELLAKLVFSVETNQFDHNTHYTDGSEVAYSLANLYTTIIRESEIDVELINGDEAEGVYRDAWVRHYQGRADVNADMASEALWYDLDYRKMLLPKHLIERMAQASAAHSAARTRALRVHFINQHLAEHPGDIEFAGRIYTPTDNLHLSADHIEIDGTFYNPL